MLVAIGFQWSFDLQQRCHSSQHHRRSNNNNNNNNNNQVTVRVSVGSRRALSLKYLNQSWTRARADVQTILSCSIEIACTLGKICSTIGSLHYQVDNTLYTGDEKCRRLNISCPKYM
jgi:hypothetical protein